MADEVFGARDEEAGGGREGGDVRENVFFLGMSECVEGFSMCGVFVGT